MQDPLHLRASETYVFQLEVGEGERFEGPMDLLLHLIEREELPITAVSLAQVTSQYLTHIRALEAARPENIAEFLVMAARLLYIKSVALLPRPEPIADEEEEDPGEALARQLREYKRFKDRAEFLRSLEESGHRGYVRLAPAPKLEKRLDMSGLTVQALVDAVYEVLRDFDAPPKPEGVIEPHEITIGDKIELLKEQLGVGRVVHFRQFLGRARSRREVIVSFLAVLELIKQRHVRVAQSELFGEILIETLPPDAQPATNAPAEAA